MHLKTYSFFPVHQTWEMGINQILILSGPRGCDWGTFAVETPQNRLLYMGIVWWWTATTDVCNTHDIEYWIVIAEFTFLCGSQVSRKRGPWSWSVVLRLDLLRIAVVACTIFEFRTQFSAGVVIHCNNSCNMNFELLCDKLVQLPLLLSDMCGVASIGCGCDMPSKLSSGNVYVAQYHHSVHAWNVWVSI